MKKGIVVEKSGKIVTLLTPDGQFLKTKHYEGVCEIGEEITFMPETRVDRKRAGFFDLLRLRPVQSGLVSMAAIVLFIFTILPMFAENKAFAYMTIDINPSFELALDSKCQVLSISALNTEGEDLLHRMNDWRKQDVKKVVDEIITRSSRSYYLQNNQEILISTVFGENTQNTYQTQVNKQIDEMTTSYRKQNYKLKTLKADLDTRNKAKEQGISTGKYLEQEEQSITEDPKKEEETSNTEEDTEKEASEDGNRKENNPEESENDQNTDIDTADEGFENLQEDLPKDESDIPSDKEQKNNEEKNDEEKNDEEKNESWPDDKNNEKEKFKKNDEEDREYDDDWENEHNENQANEDHSKKKREDKDEPNYWKGDLNWNKQHPEKKPPRNPGD